MVGNNSYMPRWGRCKLKEKIFIFSNHLGVAGTPKLAALCDSPTLSIHVPAFHRFPPNTNPVLSRTPTVTLKPALVMWLSRSSPAPRSRKLMPMKCRCITSWMTSYKGWSLNKDWFKINFLLIISIHNWEKSSQKYFDRSTNSLNYF